jgi:hypothetical protein
MSIVDVFLVGVYTTELIGVGVVVGWIIYNVVKIIEGNEDL